MNLLSLGLELLRSYEIKLRHREPFSPQDLGLATWAVETTYRHRHHTPARSHILSALSALRIHASDFERDTSDAASLQATLTIVNEHLTEVVNDHALQPAKVDASETLRIPKIILSRLRDEHGLGEKD